MPGRVNSSRPRMARRGSSDEPSTLSEGSFTAAEGCTQWYHVSAGDSCYSAIATVAGGLPLDEFYAMNPQINEDCFNLWAGFDYCVARSEFAGSLDGGCHRRRVALARLFSGPFGHSARTLILFACSHHLVFVLVPFDQGRRQQCRRSRRQDYLLADHHHCRSRYLDRCRRRGGGRGLRCRGGGVRFFDRRSRSRRRRSDHHRRSRYFDRRFRCQGW